MSPKPARAKAADVANRAVREGVQMHGGIGMTDEHDIGLYMKREAVLGELFGDVYHHREKVAVLSGLSTDARERPNSGNVSSARTPVQ